MSEREPSYISLHCQRVSHLYGETEALRDVSVTYQGSGCVALIGANGAGKSTLLRGIVGAQRLSAGSIHLGEAELYPESPARASLGYLSEHAVLPPDLSVEEVLWGATVTRGLTRREGVSALEWALERCQLIELSDRRCSTLSRGQRQRTRLASVLVHRPKLLVLDEVHSGLDPLQTVELNQLLSELARDCLVLLSTHRLSAAEEIADAYWVLHRGRLLAAGPISAWSALKGHHPDLTSEPLLTTVNGGSLEHAYLSLIAQDQIV